MESSRFNEAKNQFLYIPQIFAYGMEGVNRKEFPDQGSGTANYKDGIPSIYSVAPSAGGKYVERADINGIGWLATQLQYFMQVGQFVTFNQEFCSKIGGYPFGAILQTLGKEVTVGEGESQKKTYESYWVMSLKENNMGNFNDNPSCILSEVPAGYDKATYTEDKWLKLSLTSKDLTEVSSQILGLENQINAVRESVSKAYKYKGSVNTYADLARVEDPQEGDVYNVIATGDNYAYVKNAITVDGEQTHWDSLGKVFDLTALQEDIEQGDGETETACNLYTDGKVSGLKAECVLKTDILKENTTTGEQDQKVYNVPYINGLLSDTALNGADVSKKGYTANYINSLLKGEFVENNDGAGNHVYTAKYINEKLTEIGGQVSQGSTDITKAYQAADEALKEELEGEIDKCFKSENLVGTKVESSDASADTKGYTAKYINGIEDKADAAQETASKAEGAAEAAQNTADGAQSAAEAAQKTADESRDYYEAQIALLIDRISGLEQKVDALESWINSHSSTSSTGSSTSSTASTATAGSTSSTATE